MNTLEAVFAAVADTSWRASVLIVLVFGLRSWLRGRVPAWLLFGLWLAVALRLLLPVSVATAWSPFNLATWKQGPEAAVMPSAAAASSRAEATAGEIRLGSGGDEARFASSHLSWTQWAALAWCSVAGVLLLGRAVAWLAFAGRVRWSTQLSWDGMPADVRCRLRARGVRVALSDAVSAPALHGILRPCVLFPPGLFAQLSPAEIRLIIAHELAHVERRDLLADALLQVAAVVHWFNPLAWLAVCAARRDCELACDERVMRGGTETEREDYGATLLKIVRLTGSAPRTGFGLGVVASKQQLKRRIQMILANPTFAPARTLLCAALIAAITGSSFTSETQAQVATPGVAVAAEPAPVAFPATGAAPIVYNAEIDRLDHLFPTGIAATVNDRSITVADVRHYIAPLIPSLQREARTQEEFNGRLAMLQNSAIKDLVNRAVLIRQFHDRREGEEGKRIPPEYVDNAIAAEMKERFEGDRQKLLDYLRTRNVTLENYRRETEENIIYQYMRGQERKITGTGKPTRTPPAGATDKTIRLRVIQLSRVAGEGDAALLEKAKAILARFKNGEAFEQLAREFDRSARQDRGGDWGWNGPDDLKPPFREMAMALRKGEVSEPILMPEDCFLLYAEERR